MTRQPLIRPPTGTREWACHNANCCKGCAHGCIYCFARSFAVRFGRMRPEEWVNEVILDREVRKDRRRLDGTVMFPSTHDITPNNFGACATVLEKLLTAGNRVLIVSKPHLACIQDLCRALVPYKTAVLFRFTMGLMAADLRRFWEPHAPDFAERVAGLRAAFEAGYATSVSAEPLLEPWNARGLVETVRPYVTHSIWVGKANQLRQRTAWKLPPDHPEVLRLLGWQTKEKMLEVYGLLKDDPLIRWKDSYKQVLGLARPHQAGLDV